MEANKLREIVNEVNPPVRGKPMTLTKELSSEIASAVPFWAALLRNRDIRSSEGGDEYITGLIEAFSRIYAGLKAKGAQSVLVPLDLDTLYSIDAELQKNDMGLADEYPALEMIGVKEQGSFGAGTLMAYALFEAAVAIAGGRKPQRPGMLPGLTEERQDPVEPGESLAEDLLAGLPEETSSPPPLGAPVTSAGPAPSEPASPPNQKARKGSFMDWDYAAEHAQVKQVPLMVVGIFPTANGIMVKGELPSTLSGVAQAYNIVQTIFGLDANISMGPKGLEFSFTYLQEGGKP